MICGNGKTEKKHINVVDTFNYLQKTINVMIPISILLSLCSIKFLIKNKATKISYI